MKLENIFSRWIETWLRLFGIWPGSPCILLRRLFWAITLIIEQTFQYRYIITHFYSVDFSEMMNIFSEIMAFFLLSIKLGIFWYKQRTFDKILAMMAIDWEKCSGEEYSMFATAYKAKLSQRFANFTVALYSIAVIFYSSNIFASRTSYDDKTSNVSARPLILKMELPIDSDRRFAYELIIIAQFLHLWSCACAIGILNALLINLILHIGGQIDILRGWLMNIFPKKKERDLGIITVKRIIKKHQRIIVFSEHIEDLYSNIAMVLFVSDTLIICCLGFILVASVGTPDASKTIIRTLLFYFVINLEAFTFCFAGEYLSAKSKTIGDAAYDSLWYESDSKNSRIVLLLIMRSQNELTITIGKTMNLSLERFSSIIKASASYVSVLLAMY